MIHWMTGLSTGVACAAHRPANTWPARRALAYGMAIGADRLVWESVLKYKR